jgi:hypothetical protein
MQLDGAGAYSVRRSSEEAYAIVFIGSEQVHGLGYDEDRDRWFDVKSVALPYSAERAERLRRAMFDWVELTYPSAVDAGEIEHLERDDGHDHDDSIAVSMGPGAEFDCPECEWFRTGRTTSPRTFTDHLEDQHGYTTAQAREALH